MNTRTVFISSALIGAAVALAAPSPANAAIHPDAITGNAAERVSVKVLARVTDVEETAAGLRRGEPILVRYIRDEGKRRRDQQLAYSVALLGR